MKQWLIDQNVPGSHCGYRAIIDDRDEVVCAPSPMGEENARLIAAAPQLLAALEACVEQIRQMRGMFGDSDGAIQAALDAADEAIGRAYGQPSIPEYEFYEDDGHGWLKVPIKTLVELGIENDISTCSYVRGEFAYLEEDCDLSVFIREMRSRGIEPEIREIRINGEAEIRNYARYRPEACRG